MNILAAILILGATGHAERSMETDASIGRIVGQCIGGLVKDGWGMDRRSRISLDSFPQLTIDGQPREGLRSWGEACWTVGGLATDRRSAGSVGYSYRLHLRGYNIRRETAISDGHVLLTTDAWWTEVVPIGRRIRKVPIHVTITISASERSGQETLLVGTARGTADTRDFRCGLVRRIAERQATASLNAGLRNALAEIERRGRLAYAGGAEIADVLDGIHLGIKIAGRMRR